MTRSTLPEAPLPALKFEPEAFELSSDRLMGRHSAGYSFFKALVQASTGHYLVGFGPNRKSGVFLSNASQSFQIV